MRLTLVSLALACVAASQAVVITQWNFNSNPPDTSTSTGTLLPSIGAGTAAGIGGVTASYTAGTGSSDPAASDNTAMHLANFPAQGVGSGTAGAQFNVSTVGFANVIISFDRRHSASASRWVELQYSTNGTTFTGFQDYEIPGTNVAMVNNATADLSAVAGVANNPNFAFRIVAVFGTVGAVGGTTYATVGNTTSGAGGSNYATSGTIRYDMVTVNGQAVPEPATMAVLAIGAVAAMRRRKK
ncbi:MAG: PEP-CTERM sorting domain-containing protein [Armatimonadetes bacterium]|nr:PEP-CTERM sorting domain-containing protein [Armatimonadota bacterium]